MVDVTSSQKMQLRQNGLAATRPRMALLKVLESQAQPLHIDDIVELAGGDLALSTVYRAVGELLEVGLVSSLNSPEGRKMVELSTEHTSHHHHVLCKGCDSATDIQFTDDLEEQIEAEMKLIAETMGVEVHSHSLEILGICRDCASDSTTCFCRGDNCESDK